MEYNFRIYILLHIKKQTLLRTLFCLFLKSSKAFTASSTLLAGKDHINILLVKPVRPRVHKIVTR